MSLGHNTNWAVFSAKRCALKNSVQNLLNCASDHRENTGLFCVSYKMHFYIQIVI